MNIETIKTERLTLRKITPEVYRNVFEELSKEEIKSFFNHASEDDYIKAQNRYKSGLEMFNKTFLYFFLIDPNTDKNIGWCGYHTWYQDHDRAEIGYGFNDMNFEGKGLMTEAMATILEYGFEQMNLHRVEAFVSPNNNKSLALMKKFNFIKEGHLREHYVNNGVAEDSLVFSLLKREYS